MPYVGVYLADLISIEEGVQNLNSNGLINFAKMRMVRSKLVLSVHLEYFFSFLFFSLDNNIEQKKSEKPDLIAFD